MCTVKSEEEKKYEIPDENRIMTLTINGFQTEGKYYRLVGLQVLDDRIRMIKKHQDIYDEIVIRCKIGAMKKRIIIKGLFNEIEEGEWE